MEYQLPGASSKTMLSIGDCGEMRCTSRSVPKMTSVRACALSDSEE